VSILITGTYSIAEGESQYFKQHLNKIHIFKRICTLQETQQQTDRIFKQVQFSINVIYARIQILLSKQENLAVGSEYLNIIRMVLNISYAMVPNLSVPTAGYCKSSLSSL